MQARSCSLILVLLVPCFLLQAQSFTLIKDINQGVEGSSIRELTLFNNYIIFSAEDKTGQNNEPWISDGTPDGTFQLKDIVEPFNSYPREFTEAGGFLYFVANNQLWFTDGTKEGTKKVEIDQIDRAFIVGLTALKGAVYFGMSDAQNDIELWRSDGTVEGTARIKDINPDASSLSELLFSSGKPRMVSFNERIYFVANDGTNGHQVWSTDGTSFGTQMVDIINKSESIAGLGTDFSILKNALFFTANEEELWMIDAANEDATKLISTGVRRILTVLEDKIYFTKNDNTLWATDGSENGTSLFIKNIAPEHCTVFQKELFCADLNKLWKTDGTVAGSRHIATIQPEPFTSANIFGFTQLDRALYFVADDSENRNLWVTDGLKVEKLLNAEASKSATFPIDATSIIAYKSALFFNADYDEHGAELWKYSPSVFTSVDEIEVENDRFQIYPNPAQNQIQIRGLEAGVSFEIVLFTSLGESILKQKSDALLHLTSIPAGIYFVEISQAHHSSFHKLVIKR